MIEQISSNIVKTRKAHNCWGCMRTFPPKTEMEVVVSKSYGELTRCYWCSDCQEFLKKIPHIEKVDGFFFGDLLEWEEYRIYIEAKHD